MTIKVVRSPKDVGDILSIEGLQFMDISTELTFSSLRPKKKEAAHGVSNDLSKVVEHLGMDIDDRDDENVFMILNEVVIHNKKDIANLMEFLKELNKVL